MKKYDKLLQCPQHSIKVICLGSASTFPIIFCMKYLIYYFFTSTYSSAFTYLAHI